jgi:hypothetical protein
MLHLLRTMAPSFSSLNGGNRPPYDSSHQGTFPDHAHHRDGESVNMSGRETTKNQMKLRVAVPFTADDKVNRVPVITKVLETALMLDSTSCLKSPGVMTKETFRSALAQQHKFNNNTIGISVIGIGGLEVEVQCNGTKQTLASMIQGLRTFTGGVVFNGIEPTKLTAAQGRFILLTQKTMIDEAQTLFDQLLKQLAYDGLLDSITMEGQKLCRLNQVQSKTMVRYAEGLADKFKPMETVAVPTPKPPPTRNAWTRTPKFKFDEENFPDLSSPSCIHAAKKPRRTNEPDDASSQQSDPSQRTLGTALTDKRTEFVQKLTDDFSQKLNLIKKDNQEQRKVFEQRLAATEKVLASSQQQLLQEFHQMTANYANANQSYANLRQDFIQQQLTQDRCYVQTQNSVATMMKILINVNQSLADGCKPVTLTPDQVKEMTQTTHGTTQGQVTPVIQRTGAPGNTTESSTAGHIDGSRDH